MSALPATIQVLERGWLSSNNVVLFAGDEATLIDSGYVAHAAQTVELVNSALAARRHPTRLTRLINTHSHSDHIGGNAALQAAFGCRIAIPAGIERMVSEWDTEALLLDNTEQIAERFAHDETIAVDSIVEMGESSWQALAAPGHDMNALAFYDPVQRILISGDALWHDGFGIIFGGLQGDEHALPATRATLEKIGRLALDHVIPGHGAAFSDVDAALQRAFRRLESFEADSGRLARNAVRGLFVFNLLHQQKLREDDLPDYLKRVRYLDMINRRLLHLSADDFARWLLGDLLRAGVIEVSDGWIFPARAP